MDEIMPRKLTKYTTEVFIEKARKIHGNKYDYSKVDYVNAHTKIIIICYIHGEFLQTPNSHLNGNGCQKCAVKLATIRMTLTIEEFIIKARKVHKNKYDYSKVNYVNFMTNVIIICPIHGEFLQTPNCHISGHGCHICGGSKKLTRKIFIEKAKKIHANQYDYSKVIYINALTNVIIGCPVDGYFSQNPHNHLMGRGCPICKTSKGEIKVAKTLKDKKIKYIKQKTFKDCINPKTNHRLLYDFYLPKYNILIEYNGMQHYHNAYFHNKGGNKTFKSQQYRDSLKKSYALSHGYKFLVIKYNNKNIKKTITEALSNPTSQP